MTHEGAEAQVEDVVTSMDILALPLLCLTTDKLLNLSEPQFPPC